MMTLLRIQQIIKRAAVGTPKQGTVVKVLFLVFKFSLGFQLREFIEPENTYRKPPMNLKNHSESRY